MLKSSNPSEFGLRSNRCRIKTEGGSELVPSASQTPPSGRSIVGNDVLKDKNREIRGSVTPVRDASYGVESEQNEYRVW